MAETRRCDRCGTEFVPQREHARFCSARCRVAWNRENWNKANKDPQKWGSENWADGNRHGPGGGPESETGALGWAIVAMRDTTDRLGKVRASDRAQAFAVIGEAVWWVTIVDATLVRYYPDVYDDTLAGLAVRRRRVTEATFGGLRFVRNRMGYYADHADFIEPTRSADGASDAPITEWTWRSLPVPAMDSLPPRGQEWELSRHQAYQDRLAGRPVGETFAVASAFLALVSRTVTDAVSNGGQDPSAGDDDMLPWAEDVPVQDPDARAADGR
jgi:hypothetical protein